MILAHSRSFYYMLHRIFYRMFSSMWREEMEAMEIVRKFAGEAAKEADAKSPIGEIRVLRAKPLRPQRSYR